MRKITKKELDDIRSNLHAIDEEMRQEEEKWKSRKETIGRCACGGQIVLRTSYMSKFNPMSGPIIIGPGSRGQFRRVERKACFCDKCGIKYKASIVKKKTISERNRNTGDI